MIPRLKIMNKLCNVLSRYTKPMLYKKLIVPLIDYADIVYDSASQKDSQLFKARRTEQ